MNSLSLQRLLLTLPALLACLFLQAAPKDFTVVIDPGHGGKDYGAVGAISNEKTINLDVALEVKRLLADYPQIKVVMTRSTDRFIELQERAAIANRAHGNLFMSIHVNSVDRKNRNRANIHGASVYALGLHKTASNLEVAKRENSVMELEPDYSTKYQGFDPNSTESYIIFELNQNKHLDQSIQFAELAQGQLVSTASRGNRGVMQAGFWVLHASAMPAVLVELDFICNPTVEKYLSSKKGKHQMALALANAILNYAGISDKIETTATDEQPLAEENTGIVTYRVQFMAADRQVSKSEFKGLDKVESYQHGGMIKYTTGGDFATEQEAERHATVVKQKFPQAFVIKWQNGQRIN